MTVANEPALRVLLLEDSRVDQELIARSLRDAGLDCDIHVAGSRPDLLRQINDFVPDVVLADYSVPGLDGLAALETVRSGWPDVPFIFVSGTIGEERAIALLQRGATDYVLKSNLARLGPAVARALDERRERTARARAEAELQETQMLLQHALTVGHIGTWVAGLGDDHSVVWSAEARRIFGVRARALRTPRETFLRLVHPDDRRAIETMMERVNDSDAAYELDHRIIRPGGTLRWVRQRAEIRRYGEGGAARLYGVVQDITDQVEVENERARVSQKLRMLSRRLIRAQEDERAVISRELHDEIGQTFTALKIHLRTAQHQTEAPAARGQLDECVRIVDQALAQVRTLSIDLRPAQLDDFGLISALRSHLSRVPKPDGLDLVLNTNLETARVDPDVEIACFRIVQEALTNVLRHSNARRAIVDVQFGDDELGLSVRDDGCGFDPEAARRRVARGQRMGLLGMQERARLLGGELRIVSQAGIGTEIAASFPLPPERREMPRQS